MNEYENNQYEKRILIENKIIRICERVNYRKGKERMMKSKNIKNE